MTREAQTVRACLKDIKGRCSSLLYLFMTITTALKIQIEIQNHRSQVRKKVSA